MNLFIANEPIYVHGPCSYLPKQVMDNQALINLTRSNHTKEVIGFSTGIKQRHWASDHQACSDLAIEASRNLFNLHPGLKKSIKQLILATISGDFITPPTSPRVLYQLGIEEAGAMDLGAACAGFVTGLHTASALTHSTRQSILLIASEIRSKFLNLEDFGTSVLFGDGAASAVMSLDEDKADFKLIASATFADGEIYDMISIPAGGSRNPINETTPAQDCKITAKNNSILFVKAVHGMSMVAESLLAELGFTGRDVDWIIPHQGNKHLVFSVAKQLGIDQDKIVQTVMATGNTSGASNGIALAELRERDSLKAGQRILLTAAGGGGMAASAVLEAL